MASGTTTGPCVKRSTRLTRTRHHRAPRTPPPPPCGPLRSVRGVCAGGLGGRRTACRIAEHRRAAAARRWWCWWCITDQPEADRSWWWCITDQADRSWWWCITDQADRSVVVDHRSPPPPLAAQRRPPGRVLDAPGSGGGGSLARSENRRCGSPRLRAAIGKAEGLAASRNSGDDSDHAAGTAGPGVTPLQGGESWRCSSLCCGRGAIVGRCRDGAVGSCGHRSVGGRRGPGSRSTCMIELASLDATGRPGPGNALSDRQNQPDALRVAHWRGLERVLRAWAMRRVLCVLDHRDSRCCGLL
jgi:hypothetical protein